MYRFSRSRYGFLGIAESRSVSMQVSADATLDAERDPITMTRDAAIISEKGYLSADGVAKPDLSQEITVSFEEVYT